MKPEKGTELIEFGLRDVGHPEGACTDSEYHLALQLQKSVELLTEMFDCFNGSENEIIDQTEKFLEPYHVRADITVNGVNVTMLRRQRNTLLGLVSSAMGDAREHVRGVINMIDDMLDSAEGFKS